jgi:hypothetical protein
MKIGRNFMQVEYVKRKIHKIHKRTILATDWFPKSKNPIKDGFEWK